MYPIDVTTQMTTLLEYTHKQYGDRVALNVIEVGLCIGLVVHYLLLAPLIYDLSRTLSEVDSSCQPRPKSSKRTTIAKGQASTSIYRFWASSFCPGTTPFTSVA